jgi:hypothetical protein
MRLFLILLCAAAPCVAEPLQTSLSLGLGHSHSLLGPRFELAGDHFGGFVAASVSNLAGGPGFAAGVRWTSGIREGLVLSLHADAFHFKGSVVDGPSTLVVFAATAGYRFRYKRLWIEAAVGPALFIDSHYKETPDERSLVFERQVGFGALGGQDNPRIPDIELAVGVEL